MAADHRRRIPRKGLLDDFARMNARAIQRAAEELDILDQPMPIRQEQDAEHLMIQGPEPKAQELPHLVR